MNMTAFEQVVAQHLYTGLTTLQAIQESIEGLRRDLRAPARPDHIPADPADVAAVPLLALATALATFPWSDDEETISGTALVDAVAAVARPFLRAMTEAGFVLPETWELTDVAADRWGEEPDDLEADHWRAEEEMAEASAEGDRHAREGEHGHA